jgi:hypothetical protein
MNETVTRTSDRLAGWDLHPLEIADFHGVLSFGTQRDASRRPPQDQLGPLLGGPCV